MNAVVHRTLRRARGRLILRDAQRSGVMGLGVGLCALAGWQALTLLRVAPGFAPWAVAMILAAPVGGGIFLATWKWRRVESVAAAVDAAAPTKDRLMTSLQLAPHHPFAPLVQTEIDAFARQFAVERTLPLRPLWRPWIPTLAAGAVLATLISWQAWRDAAHAPERREAAALLERAREAVEREAPEIAPHLREELIRAEKTVAGSDNPLREALRTLSKLERQLASAAASRAALNHSEMDALAAAAENADPQLAEHLRAGDREAAAAAMEAMDPAALAKVLQQAARHLQNQRLRDLARQSDGGAQVIAMLRPSDGSKPNSGLANVLRDLRSGQDPRSGEGQMARSQPGREPSTAGADDEAPPGGSAGSERDVGRGHDLSGEGSPLATTEGEDDFLSGTFDTGPSVVEIFRSAGADDARARRKWQSAWKQAAPAALDAIQTEDIPPGSRLLVRKYFESIRPKD